MRLGRPCSGKGGVRSTVSKDYDNNKMGAG